VTRSSNSLYNNAASGSIFYETTIPGNILHTTHTERILFLMSVCLGPRGTSVTRFFGVPAAKERLWA
jgi:hypothetical protein